MPETKVGFGSGDPKGRDALFNRDSYQRWLHIHHMEDLWYAKEDHSLDDFPEKYGGLSMMALRTKKSDTPKPKLFQYDMIRGDAKYVEHARGRKPTDPTEIHWHPMTEAEQVGWYKSITPEDPMLMEKLQ